MEFSPLFPSFFDDVESWHGHLGDLAEFPDELFFSDDHSFLELLVHVLLLGIVPRDIQAADSSTEVRTNLVLHIIGLANSVVLCIDFENQLLVKFGVDLLNFLLVKLGAPDLFCRVFDNFFAVMSKD